MDPIVVETKARFQPVFLGTLDAEESVPFELYAVLFASTSVLVGVLWDISWHQSIGRDSFLSPPHLAIYLGGIVAGLTCGFRVLRSSFAAGREDRQTSVRFWRFFRGPLGAWVCIWGAIAMLTSAPFDDWWHNAYGLDVKILSPPHALLAAGIGAINLGALLMVLARQNRVRDVAAGRRLSLMYVCAAGLLLLMVATIISEYHYRIYMQSAFFYLVAGIAFPIVLAATARSANLRWPATTTALVYSGITLFMMWILPLFPAEPKLAPISIQVTRMVPPSFPLLIVVPAFAMDVVMQRFGHAGRDWALAGVIGILFIVTFMAAQWPFSVFLMSDYAQNPVFAADNFPYQVSRSTYYYRREFLPLEHDESAFRARLVLAMGFAVLSTRIGLAWGRWMRKVQR
jgi:hypothetical protein